MGNILQRVASNDLRSCFEPHLYFLRCRHFTRYDVLNLEPIYIDIYITALFSVFYLETSPSTEECGACEKKKARRAKMSPKKDF